MWTLASSAGEVGDAVRRRRGFSHLCLSLTDRAARPFIRPAVGRGRYGRSTAEPLVCHVVRGRSHDARPVASDVCDVAARTVPTYSSKDPWARNPRPY